MFFCFQRSENAQAAIFNNVQQSSSLLSARLVSSTEVYFKLNQYNIEFRLFWIPNSEINKHFFSFTYTDMQTQRAI